MEGLVTASHAARETLSGPGPYWLFQERVPRAWGEHGGVAGGCWGLMWWAGTEGGWEHVWIEQGIEGSQAKWAGRVLLKPGSWRTCRENTGVGRGAPEIMHKDLEVESSEICRSIQVPPHRVVAGPSFKLTCLPHVLKGEVKGPVGEELRRMPHVAWPGLSCWS